MEIKINFNKLFEISDSNSHTLNTTSLQNSYNFDEPSVSSAHSNNIDLHYKFNGALFFDTQATMQNDNNLNILGDLSSIGRSFDDSFEKQAVQKSSQKFQKFQKQTPQLNKPKKQSELFTKQAFGLNFKSQKTPGQRLYYEHKINEEKRLREVERIKIEKQEHEKNQITFKPVINEKSKKILELADSPLRKMENLKKSLKQKQTQEKIKSTAQKKHEQDLKNCTFHPVLIKTPKNKFTLNSLNERRSGDKVFEELYNDHKIKEMRRKQAEQELMKKQKKMTSDQLEQFLQRHEDYLQQKLHKEELMRAVSSQYDLSSGRKLFEPKINQNSEALFNSASVKKFIESPSSKKSEYILHDDQDWAEGKKFLNNEKEKSGKSKSRKSKKSRSSSKKQSGVESVNKLKYDPKNNEEPKKVKKDLETAKNRKGSFKPLPYQVSKVLRPNNQEEELRNEYTQSKKRKSQTLQPQLYQKPSSSIFSKIKATESVFEQKFEDEHESNKSERKSVNSVNSIKQNLNSSRNSSLKGHNEIKDQDQKSAEKQSKNMGWQKHVESLWNPYEQVRQQTIQIQDEQSDHEEEISSQKQKNDSIGSDHEKVEIDEESKIQENEYICFQMQRAQSEGRNYFQKSADENYQEHEESEPQFSEQKTHHKQQQEESDDSENNNFLISDYQQQIQDEREGTSRNKEPDQEKQQEMKSSFLKLIERNPQINQKYQNLFDLEHEMSRSHHESHATQRKSINVSSSSDDPQQNQAKLQHIKNLNHLIQEPSQLLSEKQSSKRSESQSQKNFDAQDQKDEEQCKNEQAIEQNEEKEGFSPIAKHRQDISQQSLSLASKVESILQKSQEPSSKKRWLQIFNSSNTLQQDSIPVHLPYSHQQKKRDYPHQSDQTQQIEESPKKKPINIASLLKGKKKTAPKPEQN